MDLNVHDQSPSSGKIASSRERVSASLIQLAPLPYPANALEPTISATTVETHYGKHHRGYVEAINRLIAGTTFALMSLEGIIAATKHRRDAMFNNAAQAWNHSFYWRSLQPPQHAGVIPPQLNTLIQAFGGLGRLKQELATAATALVLLWLAWSFGVILLKFSVYHSLVWSVRIAAFAFIIDSVLGLSARAAQQSGASVPVAMWMSQLARCPSAQGSDRFDR